MKRIEMKMKRSRYADRPEAVLYYYLSLFAFLLSAFLCVNFHPVFAQEEQDHIPVDGSALSRGEPFVFTITINSDENLSMADAQARLSALVCPVGKPDDECQSMNMLADGEDAAAMRVTFEMEALPYAGDYTLDVQFTDSAGNFADQSASYLIRGVQEGEKLEVPVTVKTVTLLPELVDEEGSTLIYSSALYVGEPYTFRLTADSVMNDSVTVNAALPESLRNAPWDPDSECRQFLTADGKALAIPGSRWNEENNHVFSCGISFVDASYLTANPVIFSLSSTGRKMAETFEMKPVNWSYYPINITKHPASHQIQITDNRGNLLCGDTVPCGLFNEEDTYILTYRFPAEWGNALEPGKNFTAELSWPEDWADALRQPLNREIASAYGNVCSVGPDGTTELSLTEIAEGRYQVSCAFSPAGLSASAAKAVKLHLNDNAWAVNDLSVMLPSHIVPSENLPTLSPTAVETEAPTEEPAVSVTTETPEETVTIPAETETAPVETETIPVETEIAPAETEPLLIETETIPEETEIVPTETEIPAENTPEPDLEITLTVKPVHLTPSLRDEAGNNLIYGSTVYVGEPYYLQIESDSPMNDSAAVTVVLPASLLSAPLDPFSECFQYMNAEGSALSIPGSLWNEANGNTFRCELRYADSSWIAANPIEFSVDPTGFSAGESHETYTMDKLSWNYYPVNIARFAASHQAQITDSRGNLICSDMVPCGVFNADDIYTLTYKFPADWGTALPSGKSFSADISWPSDWGFALQQSNDWETISAVGNACTVGADGVTHLELNENSEGRYSASCSFSPGGISYPTQAPALVHLNDNAWQVSDLNIYMPPTIYKRQAVLSPSLTLEILPGTGESEQITGGIGTLYRTTADHTNIGGGYELPALYTLKARITDVSPIRTPQWNDYVDVNWSVLDTLAQTGDLPDCLMPNGSGYTLGSLYQTEDGSWQAECSFRFPLSMPEETPGGSLNMELVSGMYNTSASVSTTAQPFARETLTVNLDVPEKMVLNQPMNIRAWLSDRSGGLSDYTRTVLSQTGASLHSDWIYNYAASCQGIYELSASGEDSCEVRFDFPTDGDSEIHFSLNAPGLENLFDIEYYPASDIHVAQVTKIDAAVTPSLALLVSPGSGEAEQINGGMLGTLYRTAGDMPNSSGSIDLPARYTLRADISGLYPNSQPQPGDAVLVNWSVLDELAYSGDLPSCLAPDAEGFRLGELTQSGESSWTASCDIYFPQTMSGSVPGGPMTMELMTASYDGSASVQMSGDAFRTETLYVDLDIPEPLVIRQDMTFNAQLSDSSGGISDYTRALLSQTGVSLFGDWMYNYATSCQGVYEFSADGGASCSVRFELPTDQDSDMHFDLNAPGVENLFNIEYRPAADIHVARIEKQTADIAPSLALQMTPDSGESEQIGGGWLGRLYRTAGSDPNDNGGDAPARYTLRANISGLYADSVPQPEDYVLVQWNVLDEMAMGGNLPQCLTPIMDGYQLGSLEQNGEGSWTASCDFYFPQFMSDSVPAGTMTMDLVSAAYDGSADVQMNTAPFQTETLYVDLNIPDPLVIRQDMTFNAQLSDSSGGISDYTRALLSQAGVSLFSDWMYNYASSCQGLYEFSADGGASCTVRFELPTDQDSDMHFDLNAPGVENLFNVEYRPAADIHVARIQKQTADVAPSLALRMTPDSGESEQIGGGWIGMLYRTAGNDPNSNGGDAPARYTLRANISGLYADSQPQPEDYVLVRWNMLDEMAMGGNLPLCLTPMMDGYQLGNLEQNGEGSWTASCDFYFPQFMGSSAAAGPMTLDLVSAAYEGSAEVQMNGDPFYHGTLNVDLNIPQHMLIRQVTEMEMHISDESGGLTDYTRAFLSGSGGVMSDWMYNYLTTCQGFYEPDESGSARCEALFESPTGMDSEMHFSFVSPVVEQLFDVTWTPAQDIHIEPVTAPTAELTVRLFHAGTEIPLPASDEDAFVVGEDYQFQFYLTPDPEYWDILSAVAVDGEGLVIDWWQPLTVHWPMLPGGEVSLNFYRDGDSFISRYDFSFAEGGLMLEGLLGELTMDAWIDGWEITVQNDGQPIRLPSRIEKKPTSLTFSDFTSALTGELLPVIRVDQETAFDVIFSGSDTYFDSSQLIVGYDANGIRTPVDCYPGSENGVFHCSFVPQCTDYNFDDYPSVCGSNLTLYASYNGDTYNDASEPVMKQFDVYRNELRLEPVEEEGSLSAADLRHIEAVRADTDTLDYASFNVVGWNVDSFLPREIRSAYGMEYCSYPVVFRYHLDSGVLLDETRLKLLVKYQSGPASMPSDVTIALMPRPVTDDLIRFDLDFGSFEMLDDGRMIREALDEAVIITGLEVVYEGSPLVAPASASYASEDLTFGLKVATLLDFDPDLSMQGSLRFDGAVTAEMLMQPFTVYCSQYYQPLHCSAEPPQVVYDENGEAVPSNIQGDGCWGNVRTEAGMNMIYVSDVFSPQCYLTAWNENNQIFIGMDEK